MRVLVTGGAGNLGSNTVSVLLDAGHDVLVLDILVSRTTVPLERVAELAEVTFGGPRLRFHRADVREPTSYRGAVVAFA